jgi:hypothetical protein
MFIGPGGYTGIHNSSLRGLETSPKQSKIIVYHPEVIKSAELSGGFLNYLLFGILNLFRI